MSQTPEMTGMETYAMDYLARLRYAYLSGAAADLEHCNLALLLGYVMHRGCWP